MKLNIEPLRRLHARLAARWTERWTLLVVVSMILVGFVMAFASVIPEVSEIGSRTISGDLAAASDLNESFQTGGGLSELRLVNTSCAISVTLLDEAQLAAYQSNGTRPTAQLSCAQRIAAFGYPLRWIIIENSGATNATYQVAARFIDVRYPRGLLTVPALPLAFGGTVYLIIRGFRRGLSRIQSELDVDDKKEKM